MSQPALKPPRRARTGRPPSSAEARRTQPVTFWVTAAEHAAIMARSASAGMSVSAFVRDAALGVTIRPRVSRHSPEVVAQLRRLGNNLNQCLYEARVENFPLSIAATTEDTLRELSALLRSILHDDTKA